MLRAFRYSCGRKVGQPIVPSVEAGVAARDRIVLVPPVVVIVRQFVERGRAMTWSWFALVINVLSTPRGPPVGCACTAMAAAIGIALRKNTFAFTTSILAARNYGGNRKTTPCRESDFGLCAFQAMEFAFSRDRGKNRTDRFQS